MAYGSAELPLCVHFGTKQSKTFALTSLEKECGMGSHTSTEQIMQLAAVS